MDPRNKFGRVKDTLTHMERQQQAQSWLTGWYRRAKDTRPTRRGSGHVKRGTKR